MRQRRSGARLRTSPSSREGGNVKAHPDLSSVFSALIDLLLNGTTFPRPTRITCFGLGSLENSRIAQLQLLLMLDLADRLNVSSPCPAASRRTRLNILLSLRDVQITTMDAYDPAFTTMDRLLLKSYGITVLLANTVRFSRHLSPSLLPVD